MSASGKLKALMETLGGEDEDVGIPLPQIVAVTSAAERVYMIPDDHGTAEDWVRGLEELDAALTALEEALS